MPGCLSTCAVPPASQVPGYSQRQSQELWRALRYFLAVEAVDASFDVQNVAGTGRELVELDDDDDEEVRHC